MRVFQLYTRKHLSAKSLFGVIKKQFEKISTPTVSTNRSNLISLADCLMSAIAVFSLKFPSLLKFDEKKEETEIKYNLRTLYQVQQAPSDTYMRERCDEVDPREIRKIFKLIFSYVQRGKGLEKFEYLDGHYLLIGDGTAFFSSDVIHCENCCSAHYNQCHIKICGYKQTPSDHKKNTYILVKNLENPWELYFVNHENQMLTMDLSEVGDLKEILQNQSKKALTQADKTRINDVLMADFHEKNPGKKIKYYHNMYCAAIAHPDHKLVLPLAPEPIAKGDGFTKNDCERNAAKRLYADARREHPHLKFIVVEDSLASNVPHLSDLNRLNMRYIVGAKPGDHRYLFKLVETAQCTEYTHQTKDGTTHHYRYINQVPLNRSHPNFKVNFLEYWETNKKGEKQHFCWVTDITITHENVYQIMRGGRSNWRIENNTFNTLKNQDYHFSHNFGHGYKNLCSVFGMLMMLAFAIDQIQELFCSLFKAARAKFKSRTSLWEKMRGMFVEHLIDSWDDLFNVIAYGAAKTPLIPNTS